MIKHKVVLVRTSCEKTIHEHSKDVNTELEYLEGNGKAIVSVSTTSGFYHLMPNCSFYLTTILFTRKAERIDD